MNQNTLLPREGEGGVGGVALPYWKVVGNLRSINPFWHFPIPLPRVHFVCPMLSYWPPSSYRKYRFISITFSPRDKQQLKLVNFFAKICHLPILKHFVLIISLIFDLVDPLLYCSQIVLTAHSANNLDLIGFIISSHAELPYQKIGEVPPSLSYHYYPHRHMFCLSISCHIIILHPLISSPYIAALPLFHVNTKLCYLIFQCIIFFVEKACIYAFQGPLIKYYWRAGVEAF